MLRKEDGGEWRPSKKMSRMAFSDTEEKGWVRKFTYPRRKAAIMADVYRAVNGCDSDSTFSPFIVTDSDAAADDDDIPPSAAKRRARMRRMSKTKKARRQLPTLSTTDEDEEQSASPTSIRNGKRKGRRNKRRSSTSQQQQQQQQQQQKQQERQQQHQHQQQSSSTQTHSYYTDRASVYVMPTTAGGVQSEPSNQNPNNINNNNPSPQPSTSASHSTMSKASTVVLVPQRPSQETANNDPVAASCGGYTYRVLSGKQYESMLACHDRWVRANAPPNTIGYRKLGSKLVAYILEDGREKWVDERMEELDSDN